MSTTHATNTKLPVIEQEKQTSGGSYFVSNYPPFQYWPAQEVPRVSEALNGQPQPDTPLGLYVHVPFCRKRCHFCYFKVYTDKNGAAIRRYMDAVLVEAGRYAQTNLVQARPLKFVYFGGGTPSYLSVEQLHYLTDGLKKQLSWSGVEEVAFECEPGTLNEKKLVALKEMGVTRLSLGVENFDPHILKINNRAHNADAIEVAYNTARTVGFDQINIDLIAGMLEETEQNWQRNIDRAIELEPDSVTIYQMEIPFNTTIYKQMKESGELTAPVADWPTKRRWVSEAFERFEQVGYEVSSAYTVVKNKNQTRFVYRDALWHGADMLALGVSSFGHLAGVHYQNEKDIEPYIERVEAGELPLRRAILLPDEQRMIRELILQMKLGCVELSYFKAKFNVEMAKHFAKSLHSLQQSGWLTFDDDKISLTRQGLMRVDRLLELFFLPQHTTTR